MTSTARPNAETCGFRPAIVAPTYNNGRTVGDILQDLSATGLPVYVVNDGSTDETGEILHAWQASGVNGARQVLTHDRNRGKAAALQTGFAAAAEAGFTHVITIDTDGQLLPADIGALLNVAQENPRSLVIGTRDPSAADYPARSRLGRRFSNLMVFLESGLRVSDSQCGLRAHPIQLLKAVKCRAGFFGFETEIITRAGWAGFDVIGTPVSCRYFCQRERVSHFRPWRDSLRALRMHAGLMLRALAPWPMRRVAPQAGESTGLRGLLNWINPARAWRQIRQDGIARTDCAFGLALGVFVANLPLYGLHTVLCLYTARRLHLHPLPLVVGSHVSTPPLGPLLVVAAIAVGHMLLHGALPTLADYDVAGQGLAATLGPVLLDWIVGGVVIGATLAATVFAAASLALRAAFAGEAQ
jgi:uncharacterized protein (DUF2062 family)